VCGDEREKGNRTLLNLGHTFGHAIEAALGYSSVSHGEAVALGLCMATYLSWRLGLGSESLHERVRDLLAGFGLKTSLFELDNAPPAALIKQMMQHDKKRQQGRLRFVLPSDLGRLEVRSDIPETLITEAIGQKGVSR
jgi:3-dehydroquinate synthase